jgi:Protein of unknown function (DUF1569)
MKTAWNAADRRELQDRMSALRPDARGQWGSMTAPQMVCHLVESFRMAAGELPVAPKKSPARFTPLKQLVIYWLPFPKGVPTAPELLERRPGTWETDTLEMRSLLDVLATRDPAGRWPDHPLFGRMTGPAWGVLIYRHVDHHLRQFGV